MKKIILISAVALFSTGAYAAETVKCNEDSLKGTFGYEISGVNEIPLWDVTNFINVTRSTHVIGSVNFSGIDKKNPGQPKTLTINGYGSAAGELKKKQGTGTYVVDQDDCVAKGTITWDLPEDAPVNTPAETSVFRIVLDNNDTTKTPNRAYHGGIVVISEAPYSASASGTLTRYAGKFPGVYFF